MKCKKILGIDMKNPIIRHGVKNNIMIKILKIVFFVLLCIFNYLQLLLISFTFLLIVNTLTDSSFDSTSSIFTIFGSNATASDR